MSNIINDMSRNNTFSKQDHNNLEFKQKILDADNITKKGNNDSIINPEELEAVFIELGLRSEEAEELVIYFFNPANRFISNDVLDIDKVFEYININNDTDISTEEINLAKNSIKIGEETFTVSEELRVKASEMIKQDGTLNDIKLNEWMNNTPKPSENDIKIVMYLTLKLAGYDDDTEIAMNLSQIIQEIMTIQSTAEENNNFSDIPLPTFTWPDIPLPNFTWPDIPLPNFTWPDIPLPNFTWPDIPLPTFDFPNIPLPTFPWPDIPIPTFTWPDIPIPTFTWPDIPIPTFTWPDIPLPTFTWPDIPIPTFTWPDIPIPTFPPIDVSITKTTTEEDNN